MSTRHLKYVVCLAAGLLLLAACGRAEGAAAPTAPAAQPTGGANALAGTRWQLSAIEQAGASQAPLPGSRITAEFEPGKLSGTAGCNSYGGDYAVSGSGITIGEMAQTAMGCEQPLMDQEARYTAALLTAKSYRIDGDTLAIAFDGGTLRFTKQQPVAERPLEGTAWQLTTFAGGDVASSLIAGSQITARFAQGQVGGKAGCNQYSSSYTVSGGSLALGEVVATKIACSDEIMAQERQFLAALKSASAFKIAGDTLTITHSGGELVFTAA